MTYSKTVVREDSFYFVRESDPPFDWSTDNIGKTVETIQKNEKINLYYLVTNSTEMEVYDRPMSHSDIKCIPNAFAEGNTLIQPEANGINRRTITGFTISCHPLPELQIKDLPDGYKRAPSRVSLRIPEDA
jgi:hypothetical protein